jgi:hypothetical protein
MRNVIAAELRLLSVLGMALRVVMTGKKLRLGHLSNWVASIAAYFVEALARRAATRSANWSNCLSI